jgi:hypothetical protein
VFHPTDVLHQLPKCSAFPRPLSVLVMDNAKIHHGQEVIDLIESFGMSHRKSLIVYIDEKS